MVSKPKVISRLEHTIYEGGVVVRPGTRLDMLVCVPKGWPDKKVIAYAESEWPCGTENGWGIRREGSELLAGCPERIKCACDYNKVHIVLDA